MKYKFDKIRGTHQVIQDHLDKLGEEGWEIVQFNVDQTDNDAVGFIFDVNYLAKKNEDTEWWLEDAEGREVEIPDGWFEIVVPVNGVWKDAKIKSINHKGIQTYEFPKKYFKEFCWNWEYTCKGFEVVSEIIHYHRTSEDRN